MKTKAQQIKYVALSNGQISIFNNLAHHRQRLFEEMAKANDLIEEYAQQCVKAVGLSIETHEVDLEKKCITLKAKK